MASTRARRAFSPSTLVAPCRRTALHPPTAGRLSQSATWSSWFVTKATTSVLIQRTRSGAGSIAGRISLSDLGRAETGTEWTPLSAFEQFATSYRQPPGPPPIPVPSTAESTAAARAASHGASAEIRRLHRRHPPAGRTAPAPDQYPLDGVERPVIAALLCLIIIVPIAHLRRLAGFLLGLDPRRYSDCDPGLGER